MPIRSGRLPLWAGIVSVPTVTYMLNVFLLPLVHPAFATLPEEGILPFLITATGVVGIWYAKTGRDNLAHQCGTVCTGLGLFGTATGLAIMASAEGAGRYEGLNQSFLSTSHGVVMLILIEGLLMWPSPRKDSDDHGVDDE